jgi:FkbM family methyltransferase
MERKINGFYWPEQDIACSAMVWKQADAIDAVLKYCKDFKLVVQAGGNCGVWPSILSKKFGVVYTFEPDAENFRYLVKNCPEHNIVKFQAALGRLHGMSGMKGSRKNCGEYWMEGQGMVPVLKIDDFIFPSLDLMCLDIEGFEVHALNGAIEHIKRYKPVILAENKGKSWKYGFEEDDIDRFLEPFGYEMIEQIHSDKIYVCKEGESCK